MALNFDYQAAKKAGYSDGQILDGLNKEGLLNFDLDASRAAGYSNEAIMQGYLNAAVKQNTGTAGNLVTSTKIGTEQLPVQKMAIDFDFAGAKKAGATDAQIVSYLSKNYGDRFDFDGAHKAGVTDEQIVSYLSKNHENEAAKPFTGTTPESKKPWEEYQTGTATPPQPDNSHTVAWGAGSAVFVAVALLAWFKLFRKTETATVVGAAAQSPIYEQKKNSCAEIEPHNLQMDATKGDAMSQNQNRILIAVLAIVAAMLVYPPFQVIANNGTAFNMGYGWIFDSPRRGSIIANVNVPMLLIQWVGVLIVGGIAFFLAKGSPEVQRPSVSSATNENLIPTQPDPMLGTKLEKLQSAKKLFFILLSIDIAVTVIDIGSGIWAIGAMKDIESGIRTGDPSLASSIDFWSSFSRIMFLTALGVGLGLVKWLKSCYQFAKESLHATGFKQEGWIVAGWIFPIFNLFKPYQVINEIYRAGSPTYSSADGWKKENGSSLIFTWWIFWAVTHFLMFTIGKEMFKKALHHDADFTIPQIIRMYEVSAWSCAISIVIAGLWFVVANHLTQRLVDRSSRYAPVPKPSFSDSTKTAPIASGQRAVQNATSVVQNALAVAKLAGTVRTPPTDAKPIMNNQPPVNAMPAIAIESSQQSMPEIEDRLYEQIAQEIETNTVDKAIWTKVYAQAGGDDKQTRVAYIKARFEKLMVAENTRLEALQREKEEIARLEQEQRDLERKEVEHFEKLRVSIKITEQMGLDDVKKLAASVEGSDFINWCCWGHIGKVKGAVEKNPLLLAIAGSSGGTALHWAVIAQQQEVAKFLAGKGASVSVRNENGKSPIDIAKESGQADLAAFLQQFSVA